MKSLVIYYSQYGGTKKIAEAICRGILEKSGQCDLRHIRDASPEDWLQYDLIGIGCPIWSSCPTTNVIYHVKALPDAVAGKHAFFFCTHGTTPGRCVIRGVQPMLDKGLTVLGWKDWYSAACLPAHPKPWFTDGHPDEIDIQEAEAFGRAMATHSALVSQGDTGIIPKLHTPEQSEAIYGIDMQSSMIEMIKNMPQMPDGAPGFGEAAPPGGAPAPNGGSGFGGIPFVPPEPDPHPPKYPSTMDYIMSSAGLPPIAAPVNGNLRIDPDLCVNCGRCVKACFCDNIDTSGQTPKILSQNCERCMFCESVCPTGAVKYDGGAAAPGAAQAPGGMMEHEIALAEARGRFRRVIPVEEIGWDTPWEKATTHPRVKEIP